MPSSGIDYLPATLLEFERTVRAVEATVEYVGRSGDAVRDAVLRRANGQSPIVVAAPRRLPSEYFRPLLLATGALATPTVEELRTAPVGVTEAFAGVSTTGSLCVEVSAGINGFASLMARLHIAVVDSESIVARPRDVIMSDIGLRSDFVFITGPSATADMGPLVRGVHGPHKLHILVLR